MENRIIKFRVPFFDRHGKFVYFSHWGAIDTMGNAVNDHGTFVSPSSNNGYSKGWHQQFSGILDKNKREVFEGDIIRDHERFYEIKFYAGCFGYKNDDGGITIYGSSWEVVGSIYENPELIN